MNNHSVSGRLVADAVFKVGSERSKNLATFTLAVTDPRNSQNTDFIRIVCWGSKADYVQKGLGQGRYRKGCKAEANGHTHLNTYKDKNGVERSSLELFADNTFSEIHPDFKAQNQQNMQNAQAGSYQPVYAQQQPTYAPAYGQQQGQQNPYAPQTPAAAQQVYNGAYQGAQQKAPAQAAQPNEQQAYGTAAAPSYTQNGTQTQPTGNYQNNQQPQQAYAKQNPYGTVPAGGFVPGMYQG